MEREYLYHTLSDGRTLAYCIFGDSQGVPIFYAHGGPGSRLEGSLFHESAVRYGFRLIATDRPGIGQSTFKANRRLLDYPTDISELADALSIGKFGVMGWSGGGAHTIVCGYVLPERLLFNIALCGYTNFAELPGAANMLSTKADQISIWLSQRFPRMFQFFFDMMSMSVKFFPDAYYKEVIKAVNESDSVIMSDPAFKTHFIADQKEAFSQGSQGTAVDAAVHYVDWGFRLREVSCKVNVFHGVEDTFVPPFFAKHLAENIPKCELQLLERQGHLFPVDHQDLIFETAKLQL
jgi:pimeloyl-ACP methyl ester carboxylesterase